MNKVLAFIFITCLSLSCETKKHQDKPNIIIFYVDDLGYSDLSSYGAKAVTTPNVDRLAREGMRFTDAHSPAATCTPSRYSLLTGTYAFRRKAQILPGDASLLISTEQSTLPSMIKKAGYTTAVVGKWHLGLGNGNLNWNTAIKPGPLEIGFDYSFLLPATGDRVPTAYLENHHIVNLNREDPISVSYKHKVGNRPTGLEHPELLRYQADTGHSNTIINGVSRIGSMAGGSAALWKDEDFPDLFTTKAINFIEKNKDQPFFLYFSFHDIHVPRLPHPRFKGKTDMGPRGDAIVQMDWMTGEIMHALKKNGLDENTLVIFSSDNGPVLNDGYEDSAVSRLGNHRPSGPFNGGKYSAFESGTRVPLITHWPERIKPGTSNALFSQIDIYASLAKLINTELEPDEAPDSEELLATLIGKDNAGRSFLIEESFTQSLRHHKWKYIPSVKGRREPKWIRKKNIPSGFSSVPQL